jgi:ubiquinone/menaquinone biosynthesis C-methylase UbiE
MKPDSSRTNRLQWRNTAEPFDALSSEYDGWFDNNPIFRIELAALHAVREILPHPFMEIGVGPGRFARKLNIDIGIDPAISPLKLARSRSILGIRAIGEQLPIRSGSIGTVFILFTLCFLADPVAVLQECARIMQRDGRLVIGMIPGLSGWGQVLAGKKKENNPFYRHAQLRSIAEVCAMLSGTGFSIIESWSTLFQSPDGALADESPRQGHEEHAGFCVLVMTKEEAASEFTQPDHPDN